MPIPLLAIALGGAAVGAITTGIGKANENKKNQRLLDLQKENLSLQQGKVALDRSAQAINERKIGLQKEALGSQKSYLQRNKALSNAATRNDMSTYAVEASRENKNAAVQAFQEESMAAAGAGTSGSVSGTPFFSMAKQNAENVNSILEMNKAQSLQRTGQGIQIQQNNLGYQQNMASLDMQGKSLALDNQQSILGRSYIDYQEAGINLQGKGIGIEQEAQDYANSPLSWTLALGAGAINGASVATQFATMGQTAGKSAVPSGGSTGPTAGMTTLGKQSTVSTPELGLPKPNPAFSNGYLPAVASPGYQPKAWAAPAYPKVGDGLAMERLFKSNTMRGSQPLSILQ